MKQIINSEQLFEGLHGRYAVKKFDTQTRLSSDKENIVKDILRLTPTSFGLQLYKFIIVKSPNIREKLREVSWGQGQITDSDFIVVFCVHRILDAKNIQNHTENIQKIRGITDEKRDGITEFMQKTIFNNNPINALKDLEEWQAKQAYIALGNLMTGASLVGIDTCPIEGMDCQKYDEILGLEKLGLTSKVVLAVGTRSDEDVYQNEEKVRYSREDLFIEI